MKYIKSINELNIPGYDRWKSAAPPDDPDCETSGELDADITFNVDKRVDDNAIDGSQFKSFLRDIDQFLAKYFKKHKLNFKAVSPFDTDDESYQDWVENEDGTYSIGTMAWKITGDWEEGPSGNDNNEIVQELLPGVKELQMVAKRYKWVDLNKIYIEDIESDIDNPCGDDY